MSSLTYTSPPGHSQTLTDENNYSQAVRLPNNTIKISGQGGWNSTTGSLLPPSEQIPQAFRNIDLVLKNAGSRGWEDVYLVRVYRVMHGDEIAGQLVRTLGEWAPHKPLLTVVHVAGLAGREMRVEIEVEAILQG